MDSFSLVVDATQSHVEKSIRFTAGAAAIATVCATVEPMITDNNAVTVTTAGPLRVGNDVETRFQRLVERWKAHGSSGSSFLEDMTMLSEYQQIIGLGSSVIPLILEDLAKEPDHWGWALEAITGENPVPEEAAGDITAIADAWLAWGRDRGYPV